MSTDPAAHLTETLHRSVPGVTVSRAVNASRRRFVVIDTAPTDHTLLLLDATGSYHREVASQIGDATLFTTPLMQLQDAQQTKVILITLGETTPVLEAESFRRI